MPDRIIKESIKRSKTLDELSPFEEVCFYRLLVSVDDYGRFYRDPQILRSELFPRKGDLTVDAIDNAFKAIERVALIKSYTVEDEQYLQVTTWGKHQRIRANKSKYPDEDGNYKPVGNNPLTIGSKSRANVSKMKTSDNNGRQMCPNSKSNANAKSSMRATDDGEDLKKIQDDHEEIFSKLEAAGFSLTQALMDNVVDLYAEYGKEAMLSAIDGCVQASKARLDYLKGCLRNQGKPRKGDDLPEMWW